MIRRRWLQKQLTHGILFLRKRQKKGFEEAELQENLRRLDELLEEARYPDAAPFAQAVKERMKEAHQQSYFRIVLEFVATLVGALVIAGLIRQMWFELYEVPTGSMRPTIKEQDRVLVSKTAFGVNIPFTTGHFFFSPNRIERGRLVVVTAEGLDLPDVDTMYFGIFPGKKRYVKRCAALPGDWIYFYGGDLFCLSADGQTLHRLQSDPSIPHREYIPVLSSFEGRVEVVSASPFSRHRTYLLKHFNQAIGKIDASPDGSITCLIPHNGEWVPEFSCPKNESHSYPQSIGEFWGLNNFAFCRFLLPHELPKTASQLGYEDPKAVAWLELRHSPTLPLPGKLRHSAQSLIQTSTTWIPLRAEQCERLMTGLYTARLSIHNESVQRYYYEPLNNPSLPLPSPVPDGTYEFFRGTAYQIGWGGTSTVLDRANAMYPKTIKEAAFWFNAGIDVVPDCLSSASHMMPTRYAYFRNGDFFVMGVPIYKKDDPVLKFFVAKEIVRQAKDFSYFAFQDAGSPDAPPLDTSFFKHFGYKVPDGHYVLLGDNPAASLDSRFFGPVPEANIQGSPVFLFWPFGERWGIPLQPCSLPSWYTVAFFVITGGSILIYMMHRHKAVSLQLKVLREKKDS